MLKIQHVATICVCVSLMNGLCQKSAAASAGALDLTAHEFAAMQAGDKIAYLQDCVKGFRERTRNISAAVQEYVRAVECDPVTLTRHDDRLVAETDHKLYQLRKIGDSYWIHYQVTQARAHKKGQTPVSTAAYSADTGVERQLDVLNKKDTSVSVPFGNINNIRSHISTGCPLLELLGDNQNECDDIGSAFLRCSEKPEDAAIELDHEIVTVRLPLAENGREGTQAFAFDLSKNGLLFRKHVNWSEAAGGKESCGSDDLTWSDCVNVSGVWMPTRMSIVAWNGTPRPRQITVHDVTVSDIHIGTLTPSQLELQFPPGTEVVDRLNGSHYRIGTNGEQVASRIGILTPLMSNGAAMGRSPWRSYSIWLTCTATIVLLIAVSIKRRKGFGLRFGNP
jgi:hypothetical protein